MTDKILFTIGKVTGVHGLNGNLKIWSYAESVDTFSPGRKIYIKEEPGVAYTILRSSSRKKGVLVSLEGIDTRDMAGEFIGKELLVDKDDLPELEEGVFYWQDLYGLEVFDHKRGFIGKIESIFPTGANEVLVVRDNDQEVLVPVHRNFVESVDIEAGKVKITLPEDY